MGVPPVAGPLTAPPGLPSLKGMEVAMSGRPASLKLKRIVVAIVALSSLLAAVRASAGFGYPTGTGFGDPAAAGFSPRVPISGFARAASWFDPSRLHLSSTVSVGSSYGVTSALQVTRLSYQFGAPLSMSVSVGNSFGPNAVNGSNPFFLEGFDLTWRPSANAIFRIEMHDVRSPLQLDPYGSRYGYGDPFRTPY